MNGSQLTDLSALVGLNDLEFLVAYGQYTIKDPAEIEAPVSNPVKGLDGAPSKGYR